MPLYHKNILKLVEYVKIDRFSVVCHFRCAGSGRSIVSQVPFEPYSGQIIITWSDILLHPIKSYNRYYHTPIVIYSHDSHETLIMKAFENVAGNFHWNKEKEVYEFKELI
ncbi:MAG: hypothetical protein JXQ67_05735 [Campylobacterales bacterium]|nr:hypothetical protein [Campylobacterales bacterium]